MDSRLFHAFKTAKALGCGVTVKQHELAGGGFSVTMTTHNKELDPVFYHAEITSQVGVLSGMSEVILEEDVVASLGKRNTGVGFHIIRMTGLTPVVRIQSGNHQIHIAEETESGMMAEVGQNHKPVVYKSSGLSEAMLQCLPFAQDNSGRTIIRSVCVRNVDGNAFVCATDGYRFHKVDLGNKAAAKATEDYVIDLDMVKLIKKLNWKQIELTKGDNGFGTITHSTNGFSETLIFKFVNGKYPNEAVLVRDSDKDKFKVYFDIEHLISVLQKAIDSPCSSTFSEVQFQWRHHRLGVKAFNSYDKIGVSIDFDTKKKAIPSTNVSVNPHYLMDILKTLKSAGSKRVRISFTHSTQAISIRDVPVPIETDSYIMPLRY